MDRKRLLDRLIVWVIYLVLQSIYNGNWTEWSAICRANHIISSAIWDKSARAGAISGLKNLRKISGRRIFESQCALETIISPSSFSKTGGAGVLWCHYVQKKKQINIYFSGSHTVRMLIRYVYIQNIQNHVCYMYMSAINLLINTFKEKSPTPHHHIITPNHLNAVILFTRFTRKYWLGLFSIRCGRMCPEHYPVPG